MSLLDLITAPEPAPLAIPQIDPTLLKMALAVTHNHEKTAIVPAGGAGGAPDPSMGAAPPPDPSAGGAPPAAAPPPAAPGGGADPATLQAVQQVLGQGGAGGKGGGKKAETQLLDTKLWTIQYLLVQLCEQAGIKLPPSVVIGPPPDPMAMAAAQQDQQIAQGAAGPMQDPNAAGPQGVQPMQPMDPSQGPIGGAKTASQDDLEPPLGREWSQADHDALMAGARQLSSKAANARRFLSSNRKAS